MTVNTLNSGQNTDFPRTLVRSINLSCNGNNRSCYYFWAICAILFSFTDYMDYSFSEFRTYLSLLLFLYSFTLDLPDESLTHIEYNCKFSSLKYDNPKRENSNLTVAMGTVTDKTLSENIYIHTHTNIYIYIYIHTLHYITFIQSLSMSRGSPSPKTMFLHMFLLYCKSTISHSSSYSTNDPYLGLPFLHVCLRFLFQYYPWQSVSRHSLHLSKPP